MNQSQDEQRTIMYLNMQNDNRHLPINLLGLIVNGLWFSNDNVFSIECMALPISLFIATEARLQLNT